MNLNEMKMAERKHTMTIGFSLLMTRDPSVAIQFLRMSFNALEKNGREPSMTVGDPLTIVPRFEDEGRTVVFALANGTPRLFACRNETGGYTFMLAEEN